MTSFPKHVTSTSENKPSLPESSYSARQISFGVSIIFAIGGIVGAVYLYSRFAENKRYIAYIMGGAGSAPGVCCIFYCCLWKKKAEQMQLRGNTNAFSRQGLQSNTAAIKTPSKKIPTNPQVPVSLNFSYLPVNHIVRMILPPLQMEIGSGAGEHIIDGQVVLLGEELTYTYAQFKEIMKTTPQRLPSGKLIMEKMQLLGESILQRRENDPEMTIKRILRFWKEGSLQWIYMTDEELSQVKGSSLPHQSLRDLVVNLGPRIRELSRVRKDVIDCKNVDEILLVDFPRITAEQIKSSSQKFHPIIGFVISAEELAKGPL